MTGHDLEPLTLDPENQAVAVARRYVTTCLGQLDALQLEEAAELGVSELVTNAVLHGRTRITITVRRLASGRVRVDVADRSALQPTQQRISMSATSGRGLRMVASLSLAWGVDDSIDGRDRGKSVWFEPGPGTAAVTTIGDWGS